MRADPATELWVLHPRRAHDSAPPRSGAIAALAPRAAVDPQPPCRTTPDLPVHLLLLLFTLCSRPSVPPPSTWIDAVDGCPGRAPMVAHRTVAALAPSTLWPLTSTEPCGGLRRSLAWLLPPHAGAAAHGVLQRWKLGRSVVG